jgi:FAD:protein FMN transferase
MERRSFYAMGTEVELLLDAEPGAESDAALAQAELEFERLEQLLSRFRPDSELSVLNRLGSIEAGDDLITVTSLALEARERTGGLFDPTVHDALVTAGYDRTFDEIPVDGPSVSASPCAGGVRIEGRMIELEPGFRLDLGGIAKGYAVDRASELLARAGPSLVNAGGDLAGRGRSWPVGVETADGRITLALENGAIATSGTDRRCWRRGRTEAHHLIDPARGLPAAGDYLRVTVVAPTATEAEIRAKAVFLGAPVHGPAVLVTTGGETVLAGGLR